jgi:uncharacterized protein (TIGR02001 family)
VNNVPSLNISRYIAAVVVLGCQFHPPAATASEFTGIASLTSEYIYRGLAQSDGNPAFQLGLDYEFDAGIFVGAWASTIDLQSALGQRDTELDLYLGYHYESEAPLSATITVLRYTYPGQTGSHSYNHNEVLVSTTWRERYSIELGYTNDLYGLGQIGRHWELRSEWPVANAWVISAALGRNDLSNIGVSRYLHWNVGASARFSRLVLDLRWYDNETPDGFAASISAGSQFVVSLSAAF